MGGTVWKPSKYRNLLLTTIEAFDLVNIQRACHPQLRKYSYVSKAFFTLFAQNFTRFIKKGDIYLSVAPDHQAIYMSLSWRNETPRGPGRDLEIQQHLFGDEQHLTNIRGKEPRTKGFR